VVRRALGCEDGRGVDVFDSDGDGLVVREGPHRLDGGIESFVEVDDEPRVKSSDTRHTSGIGQCPGIGWTFLAQCKRSGDDDGSIDKGGVAGSDPPINVWFDQFCSDTW
jgi:hypothetical protein